jgi:hypothetical protein
MKSEINAVWEVVFGESKGDICRHTSPHKTTHKTNEPMLPHNQIHHT